MHSRALMFTWAACSLAAYCGCDTRTERAPSPTPEAAAVVQPVDSETRADTAVGTTTLTSRTFELGELVDAGPKSGSVADWPLEPRGADRYSIIHAPRLQQNLGLVGTGDAGAVSAPRPLSERAGKSVDDEPPYRGPPSAADRLPWSGSTHQPVR